MLTALTPPFRFRKKRFLYHWIIATVFGLVVGNLSSWYVPRFALDGANGLEYALALFIPNRGIGAVILTTPSYLVTTTSVGTIIGICLASAQGVVLRKWRVNWALEWWVVSIIGGVFSYGLMADLNILAILFDPDPRLLKGLADYGVWIGAIMGTAQCYVLRKHYRWAGGWIALSVALWGVSSALNRHFGQWAANQVGYDVLYWLKVRFGNEFSTDVSYFVVGQGMVWLSAGAVGGIITGRVFLWLMKNRLES